MVGVQLAYTTEKRPQADVLEVNHSPGKGRGGGGRYGGMEVWRHGGMEACRYGGMQVWRHGGMVPLTRG